MRSAEPGERGIQFSGDGLSVLVSNIIGVPQRS